MRLIDAEVLIRDHQYKGYHTPGEEDPMVVDVTDIEDAPTIEPPGWIPCSERLPEETDKYWVTIMRDNERIVESRAYFSREKRWGQGLKPIAWMPRPAPAPWEGEVKK